MADPGQPAPIWVREQRRRRPALTRAAIVRAAIELADAEGLKAVSIRQVAARLDARAMSLYSHIDSKEDLLALMADEISAELLIPDGELPAGWREAISLISRRTRENMLRHPWLVHLMSVGRFVGPNGLRHLEQSLAAIRPLGLEPRRAIAVIAALDEYTMGHAIQETLTRRHGETWDGTRDYLAQLMGLGDFPNLAPVVELAVSPDPGETFEQGLNWLLDGIERQYGGGRRPG